MGHHARRTFGVDKVPAAIVIASRHRGKPRGKLQRAADHRLSAGVRRQDRLQPALPRDAIGIEKIRGLPTAAEAPRFRAAAGFPAAPVAPRLHDACTGPGAPLPPCDRSIRRRPRSPRCPIRQGIGREPNAPPCRYGSPRCGRESHGDKGKGRGVSRDLPVRFHFLPRAYRSATPSANVFQPRFFPAYDRAESPRRFPAARSRRSRRSRFPSPRDGSTRIARVSSSTARCDDVSVATIGFPAPMYSKDLDPRCCRYRRGAKRAHRRSP